MTSHPLVTVQVSRVVQGGGAERIASSIHQGLLRRGHRSFMAVANPIRPILRY